jgi:hypothetical protein
MAKANIDLPDGTKILIEGSVEEVAKIVSLVQGTPSQPSAPKAEAVPAKKTKHGIKDYVLELKAEGFFKDKRALPDVQKALEARGHIYAMTSLSGPMLELVRSKELGRVKENRKWMYVHRG